MIKVRQLAYPKSRNCPRNERAAELYEDDFRHIAKLYEGDFDYIFAGEVFRDKDSEKERQIEKKQVENSPETFHDVVRKLANELCEKHSLISTYKGIYGGRPHIKGIRLSVTDILSALVIGENIQNVIEEYNNDITKEQVEDALQYAKEFLDEIYSL